MKLSEILQKIDSIEEGKKGVDMPNTHIKFVGFGKDSNGNSVIKL